MIIDQIVFEDTNEQFGFTQLPNAILTSAILNPTEKCIYAILRRYASMPKGAMPSVPTICAEANISRTTYSRAIKTFIRSTKNLKPAIPLITSIHRANQSNVFKIHKLTDELISKLKPIIAMPERECEELKQKHRKKRAKKGTVQNETPFENTREFHFEPPHVPFKSTPLYRSNRHPSNIELNNIEQQQQEHQKNVVVVLDEFKKIFKKKITEKQAEDLIQLAIENEKDILDCIKETATHFEQKKEQPKNHVGAIHYAITNGWEIAPLQVTATKVESDSARIDKGIHTWIALGRSPEEPAFRKWVEQGGSIHDLKQLIGS